jgi:Eco29kI restriction endonuclease
MTPGFKEFEFDLPEALLANLILIFDQMDGASLTPENLTQLPDAQGVYQLYLRDELVYIGKTDGDAGLRRRLERHAWTIQHRRNLEPEEVKFRALRVFVFTAVDLETQLINHYKPHARVSWNNSGFGSNDPGRNRDDTRAKAGSFDALYPIDLDRQVELEVQSPVAASDLVAAFKHALPYTVRVQTAASSRRLHPDLDITLTMSSGSHTTRTILKQLVSALPTGWQSTLLAGRIILYKENRDYDFGEVIARS